MTEAKKDPCKCGHMRDKHFPHGGSCKVGGCDCPRFTWKPPTPGADEEE